MSQSVKRYVIVFRPAFVWGLIGLIVVFASSWVFQHSALNSTLKVMLALLPLIPGGLFLYALVQGIRGLDELQQRIYTETATMTFIVTVLLTFLFGSLERAGLYSAGWDDVGNSMMLLWIVIYILNDWRYR